MLSRSGGWEMPFHAAGTRDERYIVKIKDLELVVRRVL